MGLYDTVRVDLDGESLEYQTKDLDCNLEYYLVNENGIHIKRNGKFYKVPWICGRIEVYYWNLEERDLAKRVLTFEEGELK